MSAGVEYEPVIGLEIHVQLKTTTKMFCGCLVTFGDEPNTHTCAVCLGLPGALPVANERAIHFGVMIGLALGCDLSPRSLFHRKNYFYPDNPKAYQISQYDIPLCRGGRLGDVRIHRVHLEEDAAKLNHSSQSGRIHGADRSWVDFNRCGTPLVEIVTEPDVHSAQQAREWLIMLRQTLAQIGVSDVDMSQGSLRCDANVSVRPVGTSELGTKTELKNMNSFAFLEKGVNAEIERQVELLRSGQSVLQETLHFDPASGELTALRSKEEAHDYRYFPEPDLLPVLVTEEMLEAARAELPTELPTQRIERFERELGLSAERARLLTFRPELGDYFEQALAAAQDNGGVDATELANWIPLLVERIGDCDPASTKVAPASLAALAHMVVTREVNRDAAREVLTMLVENGGDPREIVEREGLGAISGESSELAEIVDRALAADPDAAEQVRAGNMRAIGPLVGYVMRETKGRADGKEITAMIRERLGLA
jgi:aspartyl-tRNA(Asn)/glutamyl-tRNA(Gln) amidotransferase subunit B